MRLARAAASLLLLPFLAALATAAPVITAQPQDQSVGSGENGVLTVTASGATGYQWFKGASGDTSSPVPGATGALCITLPLYAGGQFWVQASDASGSTASRTVDLSVSAPVPGRLMGMGRNDEGQLGGPTTDYRPTPLPIASGVTRMSCHEDHTLFIKEDGSLWALGYNGSGEFGNGTYTFTAQGSPVPVTSGGPVLQVATGSGHSLFLRADGTAWSMGSNGNGQLGLGTTSSSNTPKQVMAGAVQVVAGSYHSHFLKADGTLWAAGYNYYGQLGDGSTTQRNAPVQVASGVASVSTRNNHTLLVKTDGTLWAAGNNTSGQLGDGTFNQHLGPVPIASGVSYCSAGYYHSIFRKTDGTWWAMGSNDYGELGDGSTTRRLTPVNLGSGIRQAAAGGQTSLWVKDDGFLRVMGLNSNGQAGLGHLNELAAPQPKLSPHRAIGIAPGYYLSLFLDASPRFSAQPADVVVLPGQAASFSISPAEGADVTYQWYRGASGDTSQPVGSGLSYSVPSAVADAQYWVRISNAYGSSDSRSAGLVIATQPSIQTPPAAQNIAAGEGSILRVQASGGGLTYQWYRGATGDTSAPLTGVTTDLFVVPPLYATQSYWVRVSTPAGSVDSPAATIAVAAPVSATLRGCGTNASYQLGTTDGKQRLLPDACSTDVIAFDAGSSASYFIKSDHALWEAGQSKAPAQQGTDVIAVSGGSYHALFIKQDLSAWGMRSNSAGQLGDGGTATRSIPVQVATNVARVSAGTYFSFFVKTDGSLWATGRNDHGQFGNGTWDNSLTPVYITSGVVDAVAAYNQGFFLKADGTLWGMGDSYTLGIGMNSFQMQAVPVQIASDVSRISGNFGYTLFLKTDGSLWTTKPVSLSYQANQVATGVVKFAAGETHAIFTNSDGSLWGLGSNGKGQLGTGNTTDASTPVLIASGVLDQSAGDGYSLFTDLKPGFTQQPFSGYVATGTSTTLSVTGVGTGGLSYQWYRGDRGDTSQPLAGEVSSSYTTAVLSTDARYWVRITDSRGSWDSQAAVLTVVSPPQITKQPVAPATAMPYGSSSYMFVNATGGGLNIRWYRGLPGDTSTPVTGATGSSLLTPPLTGDTGFWVRITNVAGSVDSVAVPVTMAPFYPAVLRSSGLNTKGQLGIGGLTNSYGFKDTGVRATDLAAGANHSLFVKEDGSAWSMGDNSYGQLGDNSYTQKSIPVKITDNVVRVAAGDNHSMFLKRDGTLWGCGRNDSYQLGTFNSSSSRVPQQITTNVVQVAAGASHTLYLKIDGSLWVTGFNGSGQTGTGGFSSYTYPTQIATSVVKIAAGGSHSLFLKSDGTVWAMGLNSSGQLGDGSTTNRSTPVQVAADLAGAIRVVDIAAGGRHSLLLRSNGSVWTCGSNNYGQAGLGATASTPTWTQITSIPGAVFSGVSAGYEHSFILRNNGALYTAGRNQSGQLGLSSSTTQATSFVPAASVVTRIAAGTAHSLISVSVPVILSQSGDVGAVAGQTPTLSVAVSGLGSLGYTWYRGESGDTSQPTGGTSSNFETPAFSGDASYWVRVTGSAGSVDSQTMHVRAVSAPAITAAPLSANGILGTPAELSVNASGGLLSYQWYYGSPGNTSTPVPNGSSALLETLPITSTITVWVRISNAAGSIDSPAATITAVTGYLFGSGYDSTGQLGDGIVTEEPLPVKIAEGVASATGGDYSNTFLIRQDGSLWGAGSGGSGLFSADYPGRQSQFVPMDLSGVVQIASGASYTLFRKNDGTLWGVGYFRHGVAGAPSYAATPLQFASGVTAVASGFNHFLFVTQDGKLWGAGSNFWGELGDATREDKQAPTVIATGVRDAAIGGSTSYFVKSDGTLWGMGLNFADQLGDGDSYVTTPVMVSSGVDKVSAGSSQVLILKSDGTLWGNGDNYSGQLGLGDLGNTGIPQQIASGVSMARASDYHSIFLKNDGSAWTMGSNSSGQLGTGTFTGSETPVMIASGVSQVDASNSTSYFVKQDGSAWAMGSNTSSQFGNGLDLFREEPMLMAGPVSGIAAAPGRSFFLKPDGSLWATGSNRSGQLGDGSNSTRYQAVQVAGGVAKVRPGWDHTLFIKTDGSLWGMGYNGYGQLGLGNTSSRSTPVQITTGVREAAAGGDFSLFVKNDGKLWGMGSNENRELGQDSGSQYTTPTLITSEVKRVAAGSEHALFLKNDGSLWAMGGNDYGQAGPLDGWWAVLPRQVASGVIDIAAGDNHSLFVKEDGSLWGFGQNYVGQLGFLDGQNSMDVPTLLLPGGVSRVWASGSTSLYLKTNGELWQLDDTPVKIASGVMAAASGGSHTLFLSIAPVITAQPESVTVAAGSSASFSVTAAGNDPLSYQWFQGTSGDTSHPLTGGTAATFTAPAATAAVNYWVRVSNAYAHADSDTVVLAISGQGNAHYQSWASGKGLVDLSPAADPDGDGLSNYEEYFFNTDPLVRTQGSLLSPGIAQIATNRYFTVTFRHLRSTGASYHAQWSPDLANWSFFADGYEVVVPDVDGDGSTDLVRVLRYIGPGEPKGFIRITVPQPAGP